MRLTRLPLLTGLSLRRRPQSSFRRQLSTLASAGVLLLALLSSLVSSWQASRQIRATLVEQGQRVAQSLAGQSALALMSGTGDNATDALRATLDFPDVIGVEIRSLDGQVLLTRGQARVNGALTLPAPSADAARLAAETSEAWHFIAPVVARRAASPFEVGEGRDELLGDVRVVQGKGTLRHMMAQVFFTNLAVSLSIAVLFVLAIRVLASRLTRPLTDLSEVMVRAERGDREVLAQASGTSDIEQMAHAFNRMITAQRGREDELQHHREQLEAAVRERTAELLQAKERAESANAAKSQFLARMSHELRTPLNAVIGYAQILKMDGGLTERQRVGLDNIHAGGEHLLTLIVDILDLARIEAGRIELFPGPVRPQSLLRSVADIVRLKAEEKGLAFNVRLADGVPAMVVADEKRLRQVLINLLGNAVKFTDGGHVTLVLRPGEGPTAAGCARLRFEVSDSGVGIAPEALERLFQPFEQAGEAHRRAAGTGLGLAISRQLVGLMGGDIHVRSQPGSGSLFWFEIDAAPAAEERTVRAVGHATPGYEGPRRRVLVADDVPVNRKMLCELLRQLGFEAHEAADGLQALDQVRLVAPDLVLMDVRMPGMDGLEATTELRRQAATARLPVIMVSANAAPEDQHRSLAAGADAFLAKPVDRARLLELLTEHLRLQWRASPA
ncbi:ATP-binding protein [Ideonella sp.]|uniref:ATP-binding protein n=1 Tax=Ideonella sp. TaxID=1929293 RepID=UPI002B4A8F4A|nr:ATP-binding protein [Ideonella sp.]